MIKVNSTRVAEMLTAETAVMLTVAALRTSVSTDAGFITKIKHQKDPNKS